jgi:ketosteroid isomerase-like protein
MLTPIACADESSDRAALEAAAQAWIKAFNAHDVDALIARCTPDIILIDAEASPVSGAAAARELWARTPPYGTPGRLTSATKEIAINGNTGWRIGAVALPMPNSGTLRNQSLEIWKRVNGEWKLHRLMSARLLIPMTFGHGSPPVPSEPVYDKPTN